jgi:adenylate kinase
MDRLGFDLIVLGAPASGKDTQAEILMKKYRLRPVESGKYWRKMAAENSPTGEHLRRTFSKGNPAPVKLMKQFLMRIMSATPKNQDLLFIGNPRLKPEAQLLLKLLKSKGRDFFVIGISLPAAEIRRRSLKRMRDDQDWKYVDNRVKMHRLQVLKTLKYFGKLNKLKVVNGNHPIPEVAKEIRNIIDDYQRRRREANRNLKAKRANTR